MRHRRRALKFLIIADGAAALCLALSAIVGMGSAAGIGLVVLAGVLILIGWIVTLGGRYSRSAGTHQDTTRPGTKIINRR